MGSLLVDRVKFNTPTTGTGTITVGAALANYCAPSTADVPVADLSPLSLLIEDSGQVELSQGVYSAAAGTITRSLVWSSTGALLTLSGAAVVSLTALAADIANTSIVDVFTANGTWVKRPGLTSIFVTVIGNGAGGGSGRKGAPGTIRTGGSGGGGGGVTERHLPASILNATETVTVPPGTLGGAAQTTNSSNGLNGQYGSAHANFGGRVAAATGGPGQPGSTAAAPSGSAGSAAQYPGVAGASSNAAGTSGGPNYNAPVAGSGGGAGGGITAADVASAGGAGSTQPYTVTAVQTFGGGAAGGTAGGGAGANGLVPSVGDTVVGGSGAGGGSSTTGNGGRGGDGGIGCGGGGGGAGTDGVGNSGAGGNGGNALVVVVNYF